ncbi:membrane-associated oxidoreductase [Pseudomonas sp. SDT291_1_S447]
MEDFEPLRDAERRLLDGISRGRGTVISSEVPESVTPENSIRAGFLRFLALGGDDSAPIHEHGIMLSGAFIEGRLNLDSAIVPVSVKLRKCRFEESLCFSYTRFQRAVSFNYCCVSGVESSQAVIDGDLSFINVVSSARIELRSVRVSGSIYFSGAELFGSKNHALFLDGAKVEGDLCLDSGFVARDEVRLIGARVEGQVNCHNGSFLGGVPLCLDAVTVGGGILLSNGFKSVGEVSLIGAVVSGCVDFDGGRFVNPEAMAIVAEGMHVTGDIFLRGANVEGQICLVGSRVSGDLTLYSSIIGSLNANRVVVEGEFILCEINPPLSSVSLVGARVSVLNDDSSSWGSDLELNGFIYDFIDVDASMSVENRILWLDKQQKKHSAGGRFSFGPQPWRQLKNRLEEMGHVEEANEVGIAFENRMREFCLIGQTPKGLGIIRRFTYTQLARFMHICYGKLTGYGYQPMLLLRWFFAVWICCAVIYWVAASCFAVFAPSNPLVFQNPAYSACRPTLSVVEKKDSGGYVGNWYLCDALPEEYTGFSPIAFSLDLLLPLVDLHQENDWAPLISTPKSNAVDELLGFFSVKRLVRFVMWCEILAGWGFSLLFVAMVSGLARRKS